MIMSDKKNVYVPSIDYKSKAMVKYFRTRKLLNVLCVCSFLSFLGLIVWGVITLTETFNMYSGSVGYSRNNIIELSSKAIVYTLIILFILGALLTSWVKVNEWYEEKRKDLNFKEKELLSRFFKNNGLNTDNEKNVDSALNLIVDRTCDSVVLENGVVFKKVENVEGFVLDFSDVVSGDVGVKADVLTGMDVSGLGDNIADVVGNIVSVSKLVTDVTGSVEVTHHVERVLSDTIAVVGYGRKIRVLDSTNDLSNVLTLLDKLFVEVDGLRQNEIDSVVKDLVMQDGIISDRLSDNVGLILKKKV